MIGYFMTKIRQFRRFHNHQAAKNTKKRSADLIGSGKINDSGGISVKMSGLGAH